MFDLYIELESIGFVLQVDFLRSGEAAVKYYISSEGCIECFPFFLAIASNIEINIEINR